MGSSTEQSEEDTFNALFKEMEKHSTFKKNADKFGNEDNLDIKGIRFGTTEKNAVIPKKLIIDGSRALIKYGPNIGDIKEEKKYIINIDKKEEEEIINNPLTTKAARN